MRWTTKARIQNTIAALPAPLAGGAYYAMQRWLGALRKPNPMSGIKAAIAMSERIAGQSQSLNGKRILEIGTGPRLVMPITYWLIGDTFTTTVDLNKYLRESLVRQDLKYMLKNQDSIYALLKPFGGAASARLFALMRFASFPYTMEALLEFCRINYIAPSDAGNTSFRDASFNYQLTYDVLEHIPETNLREIFLEGRRLLTKDGLCVHRIDFSDHFSHHDNSISAANFLQFGEDEWSKIAGNRFMYMNRLRVDDFISIIKDTGYEILNSESKVDERSLQELQTGKLKPTQPFASKPADVLATRSLWITAKPQTRRQS